MVAVAVNHIVSDPSVKGGRPRLADTRIAVADVVLMHLRLGQSLEELAGKYDVSLASLHAAMTYYYDHKDEIDESIREDVAFAEAFRRDNPSLLQEKLAALQERG